MIIPKFRAWHKESDSVQGMYKVSELFFDNYDELCAILLRHDLGFQKLVVDVSQIKLMQWTGQQDKNGKDIYEGDIITLVYSGIVYTGSVEWDSSTASFRDCSFNSNYLEREKDILDTEYYKHCIISGNIHENPELLTMSS